MTRHCSPPCRCRRARHSLARALVFLMAMSCLPAAWSEVPTELPPEVSPLVWRGPLEIEVNQAERADLERVRGVGPGLAEAILATRQRQPFASWDDLVQRLPGVGRTSALRLSRAGLRVKGQSYPANATPAPVTPSAESGGAAH